MNMYNSFINLCYDVLSKYLHFPDVADTWRDIQDGLNKMKDFPQDYTIFMQTKSEIISYVKKVRAGNIIDSIKENSPFLYIPYGSGKTLEDCTPTELYNNLSMEIPRLILKGIHQTIKHFYVEKDENIAAELIQQDTAVLRKYNLINTEGNR